MPTDQLMRIVEPTGVMQQLTRHVLDRVLAQLAEWNGIGLYLRAAVNVSVLDLSADDFDAEVGDYWPAMALLRDSSILRLLSGQWSMKPRYWTTPRNTSHGSALVCPWMILAPASRRCAVYVGYPSRRSRSIAHT